MEPTVQFGTVVNHAVPEAVSAKLLTEHRLAHRPTPTHPPRCQQEPGDVVMPLQRGVSASGAMSPCPDRPGRGGGHRRVTYNVTMFTSGRTDTLRTAPTGIHMWPLWSIDQFRGT
jgi:hypothetical protein